MIERYRDRSEAGRELAARLGQYAGQPDVLVLALPRGGVPVAAEVAAGLRAPLDVFTVRKLGVPGHEELAMGAIATGGVLVLNPDVVQALNISPGAIEEASEAEGRELARRERLYRSDRPPPKVAGKTIILVDDGLATGSTMRAAVAALRRQHPGRIVIAVPVASPEACRQLAEQVDQIICAITPPNFYAVGAWYEDFSQTTDDEVRALISQYEARHMDSGIRRLGEENVVSVESAGVTLEGNLMVPENALGLVVFAHGSGSSRHSPRNRFVAEALQSAGLGTLLIDLLTLEEEAYDLRTAELRFDIRLLADRLVGASDWIYQDPDLARLPVGYFGSSTGAAAALIAGAERPRVARAIVSRGGRPDLASEALPRVQAPTLLIVGSNDQAVIELNRRAADKLQVSNRIEIIQGAGHLFEEPGALDRVASLAAEWFMKHLGDAAVA